MISAVVKSMRPMQWPKNFFVLAGLLFTLDRHHPPLDYVRTALAFAAFCVLSGGVYLVNDILDADRDRKHPIKRQRPIASGELSASSAWAAAAIVLAVGLTGSFALSVGFGEAALAYVCLMFAYSLYLKQLVILDVMTIAAGFVLRAVAGAAVIHVTISPWLLTCTILLALFLSLAKRRGELLRLEENAADHRMTLEGYSVPFLDQLINVAASSTIIAYALYTFFSRTGEIHPYLMATLPFVLYGLFRYLLLIQKGEGVESPELLLLADKPLLIDIGLWAITCVIIMAAR